MFRRLGVIFGLTVAMPTVLAIAYFTFVAPEVYVSESRFMVRGPQRQAQGGFGGLRQGTAIVRPQDDTYAVNEFMLSRDALTKVNAQVDVGPAIPSKALGLSLRAPLISAGANFESLYGRFREFITLDYDPAAMVTTLKVRALSASDASRINDLLLSVTERSFQELNNRARLETIRNAELAIAEASKQLAGINLAASISSGQSITGSEAVNAEKLALDKLLAERRLGATITVLEAAHSEGLRSPFHLERVVQPNVPDSAAEPRRLRSIVEVLGFGLVAWAVVNLLVASIREHLD